MLRFVCVFLLFDVSLGCVCLCNDCLLLVCFMLVVVVVACLCYCSFVCFCFVFLFSCFLVPLQSGPRAPAAGAHASLIRKKQMYLT